MNIHVKKMYLPIAGKAQIINSIVNNSIKIDENDMKVIDYIDFDLYVDTSLLRFYCDVDFDKMDMDKWYEDGTMSDIKHEIPESEISYIKDKAFSVAEQQCKVYNSVAGVLSRNMKAIMDKIPTSRQLNNILNKIPKTLESVDPQTVDVLQNIIKGNVK